MRTVIPAALVLAAFAASMANAQPRTAAAEIVSLEGKGEVRQPQQTSWNSAKAPQPLFPEEFVRTLDLRRCRSSSATARDMC